jgi:hypothetical protein
MVWAMETNSYYVGPMDSRAEMEASRWLQEHGMQVVTREDIEKAFDETGVSREHVEASSLLEIGRIVGARQLILIQAYSDRVRLRAADTTTGAIAWTGTGLQAEASPEFKAGGLGPSLTRRTLDEIWKLQR